MWLELAWFGRGALDATGFSASFFFGSSYGFGTGGLSLPLSSFFAGAAGAGGLTLPPFLFLSAGSAVLLRFFASAAFCFASAAESLFVINMAVYACFLSTLEGLNGDVFLNLVTLRKLSTFGFLPLDGLKFKPAKLFWAVGYTPGS